MSSDSEQEEKEEEKSVAESPRSRAPRLPRHLLSPEELERSTHLNMTRRSDTESEEAQDEKAEEAPEEVPADPSVEAEQEAAEEGSDSDEEDGFIRFLYVPTEWIMALRRPIHASFLRESEFTTFVKLPWDDTSVSRKQLMEFLANYDSQKQVTWVSGVEIGLGLKQISAVFLLSQTGEKVLQRIKGYTASRFDSSAKRDNGYLLSKCKCPLTTDRIRFFRVALY